MKVDDNSASVIEAACDHILTYDEGQRRAEAMASTTDTAFDRDAQAKWYARQHFKTDSGVKQIHYLPKNAPSGEIRFLEVNGLISEMSDPEPIDFGVDIGTPNGHILLVLDVTPGQWTAIQKGEMKLPTGWTLDGKHMFRR